ASLLQVNKAPGISPPNPVQQRPRCARQPVTHTIPRRKATGRRLDPTSSDLTPRPNPHRARGPTVPYFPRFRASALFRCRPRERVGASSPSASENLHKRRHWARLRENSSIEPPARACYGLQKRLFSSVVTSAASRKCVGVRVAARGSSKLSGNVEGRIQPGAG